MNATRRIGAWGWRVAGAILVMAAAWTLAAEAGRGPKGPAMPKPVEAGVAKAFPGAKVVKVERESAGIVVYEVELRRNGKAMEAALSAGGEVLSVEQPASREELPAAVRAALTKEAGEARVKELERKEIRAILTVQRLPTPQTVYEAEFEKDGKEIEILIDATGKVLSRKAEADDDD